MSQQDIYQGKLQKYDVISEEEKAWKVSISKEAAFDHNITLQFTDPNGHQQELIVEIDLAGNLQVRAYSEISDEPIMVAKIGHAEAVAFRNEPEADGLDFVRIDKNGIRKVKSAEITPFEDIPVSSVTP